MAITVQTRNERDLDIVVGADMESSGFFFFFNDLEVKAIETPTNVKSV